MDHCPYFGSLHSYVERENLEEFLDFLAPEELIELADEPPAKRIFAWFSDIIQDAERHGSPLGSSRERKRTGIYLGYLSHMSHVSASKPSTYEEDAKKQVWKDSMVEEYKSIMKNDMWEVVPKPKGKPVVTSI